MIRAGMDNRQMTIGLGINIGVIFTLVFCLGSFIAGFAGLIGVPLVGAYSEVAMDALLLALIVVVVGGKGSIPLSKVPRTIRVKLGGGKGIAISSSLIDIQLSLGVCSAHPKASSYQRKHLPEVGKGS